MKLFPNKICENRNSIWVKYQSLLLARLAAILQNGKLLGFGQNASEIVP